MSKRISFVVTYDIATDTYEMDYETQEERFDDAGYCASIYNTETQKWERLVDNNWEYDFSAYNRSADSLALVLERLRAVPLENYA